jgi:TPP-dependent 2-oxoacid decarboxylase
MAIGDFLLRRLREAGIAHLFGVAGDFNLEFLQQMEDGDEFTWVGNCNELNAAYAADGYARLNGISGLIVANGVGAWSAINGIAGAYSEKVPIICVCGSVPLNSRNRNPLMHHTSADTDYDAVLRGYAQVTAAQTRLTPQNAASEIDRLILTAWQRKLPVYLELPSDIAHLHVEVPTEPLEFMMPPSDPERLKRCADAIVARLIRAFSPAILIDLDADRFNVAREVEELAGKLQLPIAAISTAKGVINETCPYFLGLYVGEGSAPDVRAAVETSDCLLTIGVRRVDTTFGASTDAVPGIRIDARADAVDIGLDNYQAVYLKELLRRVADNVPSRESARPQPVTAMQAPSVAEVPSGPLTQDAYWNLIQGFIREGDVLIAEGGTSEMGGWGLQLPPRCTFVTQALWGSIGYPVGSILGTLLAAPPRRHLLFVGDGSFQPTAQEVSTMLRHDLKPIIFLINNGGYTFERTVCGKNGRFNDIANWAYADLPKVLHPGTTARTFVVRTVTELQAALAAPHDSMIFVEAIMDKYDAPPVVIRAGYGTVEIDYGPRRPDVSRSPRGIA